MYSCRYIFVKKLLKGIKEWYYIFLRFSIWLPLHCRKVKFIQKAASNRIAIVSFNFYLAIVQQLHFLKVKKKQKKTNRKMYWNKFSFHTISQNQGDEKAVKFLTVFPFNRFTLKSKCDVRDLLPIEYLSFVKMSRKKGLFLYDQQKRLFYNVNFYKDKSKLKCETLFGKTRQNFDVEFFILLFPIKCRFQVFCGRSKSPKSFKSLWMCQVFWKKSLSIGKSL